LLREEVEKNEESKVVLFRPSGELEVAHGDGGVG
jgi:hypothetical protein